MAFLLENWGRGSSTASNTSIEYRYISSADAGATIAASGYFNGVKEALNVNDTIYVNASDGSGFYKVTAVSPNVTITALATIGVGGIGTAQIENDAITNDKVADDAIDTDQIVDDAVDSDKLAPDTVQYVNVPVTAAQLNGAYAAPFILIAAPGAGKVIRIKDVTIEVDYGSATFASGGAMALQYDSTVNGAGTLASAALAAATINAWAADSSVGLAGAQANGAASAVVNKGIYLSNLTGAFTTGTGTVLNFHITYNVLTYDL